MKIVSSIDELNIADMNILRLSLVFGLSQKKILKWKNKFPDLDLREKDFFFNLSRILRRTDMPQKTIQRYTKVICERNWKNEKIKIKNWLESSKEHKICFLSGCELSALFSCAHPAPLVLYAAGHVDLLEKPMVSIVGSRAVSKAYQQLTYQIAFELSKLGVVVVSGMAAGVDAAAHQGAIDAHQILKEPMSKEPTTIGVLGTGIDQVYPKKNQSLFKLVEAKGLLISEFPLATPPIAYHFPLRNRIIAALGQITLVTEAKQRSGSLITARIAAELGKDVLAFPGSIASNAHAGCHQLIREGAGLVENIGQVVELLLPLLSAQLHRINPDLTCSEQVELKKMEQMPANDNEQIVKQSIEQGLPSRATDLIKLLVKPQSLDQLCLLTNWQSSEVTNLLFELELTGFIKQGVNGVFCLK